MVRSGRIALPTPDWQTGALLLRHERMETRPLPDSGRRLASIRSDRAKQTPISEHNRRFLKEMAASTGVAPASLGLKGRDPGLLDDKAENETRGRRRRLTH